MASRVPARIVRFIDAHGTKRWGALADGAAQPGPGATLPIVPHPLTGEVSTTVTEATVATLLPALPVDSPAILCVGLNYKRHAAECGMPEPKLPVIFMKNPSAITGDGKPIVVPKCAQEPCEVDYEIELGVVISKTCKDVAAEDALDFVLGYVVANDVSSRAWQFERGGSQWCRAKSFDTFCPVGPVLGMASALDPARLRVWTTVNGETRQDSNTSDLVFDVASIIAFLSQGTTLEAGTLILTGTPEGVGMGLKPMPKYLVDGDKVVVGVDGVGTCSNVVNFEK